MTPLERGVPQEPRMSHDHHRRAKPSSGSLGRFCPHTFPGAEFIPSPISRNHAPLVRNRQLISGSRTPVETIFTEQIEMISIRRQSTLHREYIVIDAHYEPTLIRPRAYQRARQQRHSGRKFSARRCRERIVLNHFWTVSGTARGSRFFGHARSYLVRRYKCRGTKRNTV
jgi:hypothetical protein